MQCIKCQQNNLYIKLKENKLYCPKCQFTGEPTMILWTCISCGQEFTTNAKIYNPYEYKPISIAIKIRYLIAKLPFRNIILAKTINVRISRIKKNAMGNYKGKWSFVKNVKR